MRCRAQVCELEFEQAGKVAVNEVNVPKFPDGKKADTRLGHHGWMWGHDIYSLASQNSKTLGGTDETQPQAVSVRKLP
jgi:hypothetical protein